MINNYLIIAHPDDEIFWASYLSQNLKNLKILCLTNKNNNSRYKEFKNVCRIIKKDNEIFSFPDGGNLRWGHELDELINKLDINKDSIIVTHSPHGEEHFHPQHVQLYNAVYNNSKTRPRQAFFSDVKIIYYSYIRVKRCSDFSLYKIRINYITIFKHFFMSLVKFRIRHPKKSFFSILNLFVYCYKISHYKYMYEFSINIHDKHKLLENYKSQNLSDYEFFDSKNEFLYTQELTYGINS
jgi:LmbE family N-acetylglucosaminyl deacetylase